MNDTNILISRESSLHALIEATKQWFHDKGIIASSNALKQLEKTQEELTETRDAAVEMFVLNEVGASDFAKDQAKLKFKDGIGDTLVTLIGVCEMEGTSLEECLALAYSVISKRSGKMIDGKFVKN
jgi:adenosyl cobinamide kinase/adenosyl cobinamide phosphate guanylyltransferase